MRVFVSYSRRDETFVGRLAAQLESAGHEVWVDTDDIRGSEEWRASIVAGIRQADVVLLVVSPAAMASDNVTREITVAAHEDRRIIPVELEHADLNDSVRYELAGVQQVSFVDRPFDEGMTALRQALGPVAPGGPAPGPTPPVEPLARPPKRSRRGLIAGVAAVAVISGMVYGGIQDGDGASSAPPDGESAGPGTLGTVGGDGAATDVELDANVWFAGYEITVDHARFDPTGQEVAVDVTMTNVQPSTAEPLEILVDDITALEWNGRRFAPFCSCNRLPPGSSLSATLEFSVLEDGFSLPDAMLAFGQPLQHRALVPFDGSAPSSEQPTVQDVTGVIDAGDDTTFTVERIEVIPAACRGLSDSLRFMPGAADEVGVIVWGSAVSNSSATSYLGTARLVLPDGTALGSTSLNGVVFILEPAAPERNIPVCFAVPTPTSGLHRLTMTASIAATFEESDGPALEFELVA